MSKHISIEHCHHCGNNMRIELDLELNGNHVIKCPHCGHEHCRVVRDGKITGVRWASRNGWGTGQVYCANSTIWTGTTGSTASYWTSDTWTSATCG